MPSTLVHVALGAIVGTALLADEFDRRSVAVVLFAAAFPDLDAFAGLALPGAHRSLLHTLLLPMALAMLVYYDAGLRKRSWLRGRFGDRGVRLAWVALGVYLMCGILPDLFTNGVNALYPLHDQFYTVNGKLLLSNQRGLVQTFVQFARQKPPRTTHNLRYVTPVNPTPWAGPNNPPPKHVERVFPVVSSGFRLLLVATGAVVVWGRFRLERRLGAPAAGRVGPTDRGEQGPDATRDAAGEVAAGEGRPGRTDN